MIETTDALTELAARIGAHDRVGVDTEADSLHCYREKVCLLQIGLPDADELVDPLAAVELSPLLAALSRTEIILHGADFDLRMLYRLGLDAPPRVFDTVIAARLAGAPRYGYAALVAEHFGITLPKGLQTANWGRRPLPDKLARYARNDTHYLLPLAARLEQRLAELGRLAWLEQSCRRAVAAARVVRKRDPQTEWRVRGSHALGPRASAVLRALWYWREDEARASDRPPFQIMSSDDLVESARRLDQDESLPLRGMPDPRRMRMTKVADDALQLDPSAWPERAAPRTRTRLTPDQKRRVAALKERRDRAAAELAIDADLIAPRAALERLAIEGDGWMDAVLPWQHDLLRSGG